MTRSIIPTYSPRLICPACAGLLIGMLCNIAALLGVWHG